jgi:hypothetical protein
LKKFVLIFLLLLLGPLAISTTNYLLGDRRENWQTADRSSAGLLPKPADHPDALIRVFAARTVRWRGIFAVHTWIVVKERLAPRYSRYDYTAWGEPIRIDGFAPDGRWFGAVPEIVVKMDGDKAEQLIPKIRSVVESYKFRAYGDYRPWPGPNSNTFVQAMARTAASSGRHNVSDDRHVCALQHNWSADVAKGHQRTCRLRNPTSVLPPRPDIFDQTGHVGFVPH